jgi:hypothetical protein
METSASKSPLPLTPFIYINDPVADRPNTRSLLCHIPKVVAIPPTFDAVKGALEHFAYPANKNTILIAEDNYDDNSFDDKFANAKKLKTLALKQGRNFVSINLFIGEGSSPSELSNWGTNHLELNVDEIDVGKKIYEWLCKWCFPSVTS